MKLEFRGLLVFLLTIITQISFAQERVVAGRISDDTGMPLPGVNVSVKGTQTSAQSDFDGNYFIKATTKQILVFSYIGMDTKALPASSTTLNVVLGTGAMELEGIVVTALGIKRSEKTLGYAISKISSEDITRSGEQNIIEALASKAAGVQVIGSGGTPGSSSKIIIRGINTITGSSDPLIVVDGIPINNSTTQTTAGDNPFNSDLSGINNSNRAIDINPADIENVIILKGPAAAALYGERAGNGVILYTTKKGKSGRGIGINYSTSLSIDKVSQLPARQNKYVQGGPDEITGIPIYQTDTPQSWGPLASSIGIPMYENVGNFFQEGLTYNNNISFFGGNEKANYRASYGNTSQTGMIPETDLKRNTLRLVGNLDLSNEWKTGASLQYSRTTNTLSQNGSNASGVMLSLMRSVGNYDLINYKDSEGNNTNYFSSYDNPYFTVNENPACSDVNRILGSMFLTYIPATWLSFTTKGGIDVYSDYREQIFAISSNGDDLGGIGEVAYNNIINKQFYGDFIASGLFPIHSNWLKINYTAGLNLRSIHNTDVYSRGKELAVRGVYNLSNATQLYASNYEENIMSRALFGQLEFDLKNQLFITGSIRKEWSSTYGTLANNAVFPAASASWLLSNTFNLPQWTNFAKVTYGYGEVGIAPRPYATISTFSQPFMTDGLTDGLSFPYDGINGMAVSGELGNQNLKPERVIGHEVGLSTKFFKNRLSFDLNFYYKTSTDLLITLPLPASSGFTSVYQNAAELVNKGTELEIGYNIFKRDNAFQWNLTLNWSKNENEVTDISNELSEISIETAFNSIGYYAVKGEPLGSFYGTKWQRDSNGQIIIDNNGHAIIADEAGNLGNSAPKWFAGIRNTFSYKRITMSALLDIRYGGEIYNGTVARLNNFGISEASADRERSYIIDGVKADGTPNDISISARDYYQRFLGDGGGAAEQFVETVNWVRLRDITLSYEFNVKRLSALNSAQISFTGRNLWLDTNYTGVDPETSLTGAGSRINGLDYFNNPGSKSFIMSIQVGF